MAFGPESARIDTVANVLMQLKLPSDTDNTPVRLPVFLESNHGLRAHKLETGKLP